MPLVDVDLTSIDLVLLLSTSTISLLAARSTGEVGDDE
jgi:hypothetical protein